MKNNKKKRINEKYLQFEANGKIKLIKFMENNHLEKSNVLPHLQCQPIVRDRV